MVDGGGVMRWLDPGFSGQRTKYVLQSLMALGVVFVMSLFIDVVLQTTIIASVGATVFIVFTMPHTLRSSGRYTIGGYTIGIAVGSIMFYLMDTDSILTKNLVIAAAVGLAIFLMVITNTEHPPAAALAMGIVVEGIDIQTILAIYSCMIIILIFKRILKKWLINLVIE